MRFCEWKTCILNYLFQFLQQDIPLFESIISDLFPGVQVPKPDYMELERALQDNIKEENLQAVPWFIEKILQVYKLQAWYSTKIALYAFIRLIWRTYYIIYDVYIVMFFLFGECWHGRNIISNSIPVVWFLYNIWKEGKVINLSTLRGGRIRFNKKAFITFPTYFLSWPAEQKRVYL